MVDPGDTDALCNDSKSQLVYESSQQPCDEESGSVIREEPTSCSDVVPPEDGEEGETQSQRPSESKVPFMYMMVEPGCTPMSCYSAIITFIIMSCGVFWLLLISPPLNQKALTTKLPWLEKDVPAVATVTTMVEVDGGGEVVSTDTPLDPPNPPPLTQPQNLIIHPPDHT